MYFFLNLRPPREFSLGFGTIKACFWRCIKLFLQYALVQKLFLGKAFPHPPAFQSSLWKRVPSVSPLSGSVPSRHLFGAVAVYYRESLQYSIVQKLFLGRSFSPPSAFQSFLWKRVPPVSSLGFGTIKSSFWRCTKLLPGVSPVFDRTETILGEIFSTSASLPELSLRARPPREFYLGFSTIKACFWRCTKLLPEVSPVFDRTETILEDIFPTSASLLELSLEARPPREFSHGFGAIKASSWHCTKLLPEVSPVFDRT